MAGVTASPSPAADEPRSGRPTAGELASRIVVVSVVLGIIIMWIYVLTARPDVPGHIEDPAFAPAAESVCAAARVRIDALPKAQETPDPAQRAAVVDQATDVLEDMVDELERLVPIAEPDHTRAAQWIADWRTYLQNRRDYADGLPRDPNLRFYVTQRPEDGVQITAGMDRFAQPPVNTMASCTTPDDV